MSRITSAILIALTICNCAVSAQDSLKVKELDEVVVTATKFPVKRSLTGKVVTVITREEIEKNNGRTLGQLLNQQAGLTIYGAYNSPGTNQSIYMRGAASGRTLVLIDGIPAYDPSVITNDFDINLLSINDIQRIEVCRGAQSTLYGSDAIAGVINIITVNKDVSKPFNVSSSLAGGNRSTFKGNVQVYGKENKLTYSLRYSKLITAGFSSALDSSGKKDFDNDGYHANIGNALVQFQATDKLLIKSFFQYNQYRADIDAGLFADDKDYTINNKNLVSGAGFQFKHDFLTITGNYQYSEMKRNYMDDSASIGGFSKYSSNHFFGKAQFAELYASAVIAKGFTFLQGADYRFAGMNSQYLSISSFGPYRSSFKDTVMSQGSLYASLNYNGINTRLNVEIGGRLNVHSRYGSNSTYTFNPSYNFSKSFRAFGSIATGFKAPSLYQLYDGFAGNRNLNPEKSINYEAGVQQTDKLLSNRLVFFYREIKNGIDYNNITFKYFNFVRQTARGVEWELLVNPAPWVSVSTNYTYLSINENTQNRRLLNRDTVYNYALRRPAHNLNANVLFRITSSFTAGANMKFVSDRHDVGGYKAQDVLLDSYTIFGAHTDYTVDEHIGLFADFQNITNKKFADARGFSAIPFLFTGGVTLKW